MDDKTMLERRRALRRRVNRAKQFPTNTCPASRHLHMMANGLLSKKGYSLLQDEPEHCAESMMAVLEALWLARSRLARYEAAAEIGKAMGRG